jgi:hypothetical protein
MTFDSEPAACRDSLGGIWLFWSSRRSGSWNIWYSRFDGTQWGNPKTLIAGAEKSDREPSVVCVQGVPERIWVAWSRKKNNDVWNIFYRATSTASLDFATLAESGWTPPEQLDPISPDYDNREPFLVMLDAARVELYYASNRKDGWQVWSKALSIGSQEPDTQLTSGQFTHRAPAAVSSKKLKKLYYRNNESQLYASALYPAAQTIDARYSGSTTIDTRNPAKISLRENIQDIQRYTYDARKGSRNWYARDTVGIYLVPDTIDQALIVRRRNQIEKVLRDFLPIQVRTVFIVDQVFVENVYEYDASPLEPRRLIGEQAFDSILGEILWGPLSSETRGPAERSSDRADFRWMRTFDGTSGDGVLPDLSKRPLDLSFRLFLRHVTEGEE